MAARISRTTKTLVSQAYLQLDYKQLGYVYCWEGGDEFWHRKWKPCLRLGMRAAQALMAKLSHGGRSLYVGAGVAELAALLVETTDLQRRVEPYNLRRSEVAVLNSACRGLSLKFRNRDASSAKGRFDHLWIVSVLNDPERFPHLSPLSYGRADPVTFDPVQFQKERRTVQSMVDRCLAKLSIPGLATTSAEEVIWIADWCHRHKIPYLVEAKQHDTALVGDPICIVQIGRKRGSSNARAR